MMKTEKLYISAKTIARRFDVNPTTALRWMRKAKAQARAELLKEEGSATAMRVDEEGFQRWVDQRLVV